MFMVVSNDRMICMDLNACTIKVPVFAGQFMTYDDAMLAVPAVPGRPVIGIMGDDFDSSWEYPCPAKCRIYYEGVFGTSFFDAGARYEIFQPLFLGTDGRLSPSGHPSAMTGKVIQMPYKEVPSTKKEMLETVLIFDFKAGAVMPAPIPSSTILPEPKRRARRHK